MTGDGWDEVADRAWGMAPVVVPMAAPVTVSDAYRLLAEASGPFRAGTRFRVLPDVRFDTSVGRIRAPGELLPGPADPDPDGYRKRLAAELAEQGWLVAVEQPLFLDFDVWARVRDSVTALWQRVGFPVVPVGAELVFGDGVTRADGLVRDAHHAVLAWVLRGRLLVRYADTTEVRAGAGELAYWPAGCRYTETFGDDCLALLLRVPGDARLPVGAVHDTVVELANSGPAAVEAVPYLPVPPPEQPGGATPVAGPLARAGTAVRELSRDPELTRTLRIRWATRVSAGGLEPVPPPREAVPLRGADRVRCTAEVVRIRDGRSGWIWAVNGHAFAVQGAAWTLLRRLRHAGVLRVDELCGLAADGRPEPGALALLTTLYELRGIEVLTDRDAPAGEEW